MARPDHARDRYLRICFWAKRRYTVDGVLALRVGGMPTAYSRIEAAAFAKFFR